MTLASAHFTMLHEERAIAEAIIQSRGYCTLTHPDDLRDLGFSKVQARLAPVLAIPLWDVHGQQTGWQIRPDTPRLGRGGKVNKYENAQGSMLRLDVHPSMHSLLGDPSTPLWITEGVPKADALTSQGVCTMALRGVWGFKGTNEHGGKVILPDWQHTVGLASLLAAARSLPRRDAPLDLATVDTTSGLGKLLAEARLQEPAHVREPRP
jgi:Domain of unknown function (DUF3854)